MAKKATPASTPLEAKETLETEATTSAAIDQPAVSDDASASALSPADEPAGDSASPESSETAEPVAPDAPSSPAVELVVEETVEETRKPIDPNLEGVQLFYEKNKQMVNYVGGGLLLIIAAFSFFKLYCFK